MAPVQRQREGLASKGTACTQASQVKTAGAQCGEVIDEDGRTLDEGERHLLLQLDIVRKLYGSEPGRCIARQVSEPNEVVRLAMKVPALAHSQRSWLSGRLSTANSVSLSRPRLEKTRPLARVSRQKSRWQGFRRARETNAPTLFGSSNASRPPSSSCAGSDCAGAAFLRGIVPRVRQKRSLKARDSRLGDAICRSARTSRKQEAKSA